MKKLIKRIALTTLVSLVIISICFAQTPNPIINYKGKISFLKGLTKLNVRYDYDNMSIDSFENEQEFIKMEIARRNKIESESGNEWAKRWILNRESRNEPNFENMFNVILSKKGVSIGKFPEAGYTLIVKTIRTEPEEFYINRYNLILPPLATTVSTIDVEILFVSTNNMENVLSKVTMKNIYAENGYGDDYGYGVSYRLQKAYGYCGVYLAKYLKRKKFFKT